MNPDALAPGDFSPFQIAGVVALGVGAGCIPTLQPLLLGSLQAAGRISAAQIGQAAMAEAMGMAVATTFAAIRLKPARLRAIAAIAIIVSLLASLATAYSAGGAIIGLRAICGLCSGMLLWILVGLLTRSAAPGRLFAIYVTVQAMVALALSALLSQIVLPRLGMTAGYMAIALFDLALLAAVLTIPDRYRVVSGGRQTVPPMRGIIALIGVGMLLSGIMGLWVYIVPIGRERGLSESVTANAVLIAVACQIAGGIAASLLAGRLSARTICIGGAVVAGLCAAVILTAGSSVIIAVALAIFAFVWMFVPPFQMPLLIEIDATLQTAMLIGSAQLLGSAAGPFIASAVVTDETVLAAGWAAIGCMALSIVCVIGALALHRRQQGAAGA